MPDIYTSSNPLFQLIQAHRELIYHGVLLQYQHNVILKLNQTESSCTESCVIVEYHDWSTKDEHVLTVVEASSLLFPKAHVGLHNWAIILCVCDYVSCF